MGQPGLGDQVAKVAAFDHHVEVNLMAFAIHIDAQRRDAFSRHLHVMQPAVQPPVQRRFVGDPHAAVTQPSQVRPTTHPVLIKTVLFTGFDVPERPQSPVCQQLSSCPSGAQTPAALSIPPNQGPGVSSSDLTPPLAA